MKIAVLMSTYNGQKYLEKQLKSIAEQTIADKVTLYIRDDGSSDDTIEIINKWKKYINIVVYEESNKGPAMSFWSLLIRNEIQADYYAFCDQDDVWDQDKLEIGIKKLDESTCLYTCNYRIIDENDNVIIGNGCLTNRNMSIPSLFMAGGTQGCSMIFSDGLRQYICKLNIQCIPMHDIVVLLYALTFGEIYWDELPHFCYRIHANNVVARGNKSVIQKMKTTLWNWKNGSKNSMTYVANELLLNSNNFQEKDRTYLENISGYKKSILKKMSLIFDPQLKKVSRGCVRAYRMKIILNLF
mgnify:CR=1 FL=1